MKDAPPKSIEAGGAEPLATEPAGGEPRGTEPPDPPGYIAPLVYGREPPRSGPFERSSVWLVHEPGGAAIKPGGAAIKHTVACDTLTQPELRELLRVLFAGASPSSSPPAVPADATLLLQIDWLEHGKLIAVSRLYADGSLVRDRDGLRTLDRKLDAEALAAVDAQIDRAQLRDASRTWCGSKAP